MECLKTTMDTDRQYDEIDEILQGYFSRGSECLFDAEMFEKEITRLWELYEVPYESLYSFARNSYINYVKRRAPEARSLTSEMVDDYKRGISILDVAKTVRYPPSIVCRMILEAIIDTNGNKKRLTEIMRNPTSLLSETTVCRSRHASSGLDLSRLAAQTAEATAADPMYGPKHDRERHIVGIEFEVVLEQKLTALGIPFETETQLRSQGTAKTPDILLKAPLAIEVELEEARGLEWKLINWIDSKALFGDISTHNSSVVPQAETYVHRFGPGAVVYWFGHAPKHRLGKAQGGVVVLGWGIPRVMLPNGVVVET